MREASDDGESHDTVDRGNVGTGYGRSSDRGVGVVLDGSADLPGPVDTGEPSD